MNLILVTTVCIALTTATTLCGPQVTPSPNPTVAPIAISSPASNPLAIVPPIGVYNSCEPAYILATCESQHATMLANGMTVEINYNAMGNSLANLVALAKYDASIGFTEFYSIKGAIQTNGSPLTATNLLGYDGTSLASDCKATTNQQLILCIENAVKAISGYHYGWYIYDEPGCPSSATVGYCNASLGTNAAYYQNIGTLAAFLHTNSAAPILGIQVGAGDIAMAKNVFSCNGQAGCSTVPYPWITDPNSPNTGFDAYPLSADVTATIAGIRGIGISATVIPQALTATTSGNPLETMSAVGQAFSWAQEGGNFGCVSMAACPFPTQTQMQQMRDQALYYASASGKPLKYWLWYAWPDINCGNALAALCNGPANLAALHVVNVSAFPAAPPGP
jgi:hypothetical protein